MTQLITQQRLKELLRYDSETGVFHWLVNRGKNGTKNKLAGSRLTEGYLVITIDGRSYIAHRLAWLYVYGVWPTSGLDHINRVHDDNRITNLREATCAQNMQNRNSLSNNKSGVVGVSWNKRINKWSASIKVSYKTIRLGNFSSIEHAAIARAEAKAKYHTFHPKD